MKKLAYFIFIAASSLTLGFGITAISTHENRGRSELSLVDNSSPFLNTISAANGQTVDDHWRTLPDMSMGKQKHSFEVLNGCMLCAE